MDSAPFLFVFGIFLNKIDTFRIPVCHALVLKRYGIQRVCIYGKIIIKEEK